MTISIFSHNEASEGAKALADALDVKRIKHENSRFQGRANKTVINWGSSRDLPSEVAKCRVINQPAAVRDASNKLRFFESCIALEATERPRTPEFTTSEGVAKDWVANGLTVVARRVLNGSSGEGISFMDQTDQNGFVSAPLYVQYVKKKHEFRVHFVNGTIIDYQRKALRQDVDPKTVDWRVRNLENGFIFARQNLEIPDDVVLQAEKVVEATNLDFGAIDIIYNENQQQAYVLEVNTAPGLVGETINSYANAFKEWLE